MTRHLIREDRTRNGQRRIVTWCGRIGIRPGEGPDTFVTPSTDVIEASHELADCNVCLRLCFGQERA